MVHTRAALVIAAGLSIAALTACSIDGTPTRGPVQLDTGKYQTTPAAPAGEATSDEDLDTLRALRLGESVVFHDDVDPQLNRSSMPTYPVTNASGLGGIITDVNDEPFMKPLRYGFSVAAGSKDDDTDKGYNHAVLVFTDASAASAAADGLAEAMVKNAHGDARTRTRVPGMPGDTRAIGGKAARGAMTAAFTPVGEKLIYTWADSKDATWTATAVRVSYEKQRALLDSMKPIGDDRRLDPDGILRGVIPADDPTRMDNMVLGPRTVAHLAGRPSSMFAEEQKAGVTAAVVGGALVFKAGSDDQATGFLAKLSDQSGDSSSRKAASPQDLSTAKCYTGKDSFGGDSADCYLSVGRYVVQASGDDLHDAQQLVSAQYALLKQM